MEQIIHLSFELFALVDWVVATGVLAALNVHLHNLSEDFAYDNDHGIQLTDELISHQFGTLGQVGLDCSYALNAVAGIIA